jgi:hypothetical protein
MMITLPATLHFVVSYDDTIAANANHASGADLAQSVLDYCEYDYARLSALFGNLTLKSQNLPIAVNVVAGSGGASNDGLGAIAGGFAPIINATVAASTSYTEPGELEPLVVAELAEIFMAAQGTGWNPSWSDGESLSRVSGQILYPQNAWAFATGSSWYTSATHASPADWVDVVEQTDQDYVSVGCGSLFFNYLAYQLNYTWPAIIAAAPVMNNTLAQAASTLGVADGGYAAFLSLLQNNFPTGNLYSAATPFDQRLDDVFPLGPAPAQLPSLYLRHNTADNGTSHSPPLSTSPDIIMKNAQVTNPQATFSTPASIASANESDSSVLASRTNYLYLRVWNRGNAAAQNVFATVYYAPPATLVTPSMWTLIGDSYYPNVPTGSTVEVTTIGIPWPADQIPAAGHYCFVATVGNNYQPAPNPQALANFATFQDYYDYILANNNVTWRNFNVVNLTAGQIKWPFGPLFPLPFRLTGAWTGEEVFQFEIIAELPKGSTLALQAADWIGRGLTPAPKSMKPFRDLVTDPANTARLRIPLPTHAAHTLGEIKLPARTAAASHLLVSVPAALHDKPYEVAILQRYKGQEVGRITWRLVPVR